MKVRPRKLTSGMTVRLYGPKGQTATRLIHTIDSRRIGRRKYRVFNEHLGGEFVLEGREKVEVVA